MKPFRYVSLIFLILFLGAGWTAMNGSACWWWAVLSVIIYIHLLVLGAVFIRWGFYMKSYCSGKNKGWIALTFDDGPASETEAILDILKEQNVPAAFFSIGRHAAAHQDIVKRWDEEGHLVGNHSYDHGFNFDWKSASSMAEEIRHTNETIASVLGKTPRLFRPPYGVTNPNLAKAVHSTGIYSIGWSLRSFDTTARDPARLLARILKKLKGGDIILLHDSMPVTREILTELIVRCREKGFTFVRLDKMLDIDAYA